MNVSFVVPGVPVAQPRQRHRVMAVRGRTMAVNYTPARSPVNVYKAAVQQAAAEACGEVLTGPVSVAITFVFPRPASKTRKRLPNPRLWHTSKPDLENCEKAVLDALTGIAYLDDRQVCEKSSWKITGSAGEQARTLIRIREIQREADCA